MEAPIVSAGMGDAGPDPSGSRPERSRFRREGGLPVTAIMTGGFSVLLCWTILAGVVLGAAGLVVGVVAYRRARRDGSGGERLALVGGVLGLIGLAVSVWLVVGLVR